MGSIGLRFWGLALVRAQIFRKIENMRRAVVAPLIKLHVHCLIQGCWKICGLVQCEGLGCRGGSVGLSECLKLRRV